jgi:hypothetical protein
MVTAARRRSVLVLVQRQARLPVPPRALERFGAGPRETEEPVHPRGTTSCRAEVEQQLEPIAGPAGGLRVRG